MSLEGCECLGLPERPSILWTIAMPEQLPGDGGIE